MYVYIKNVYEANWVVSSNTFMSWFAINFLKLAESRAEHQADSAKLNREKEELKLEIESQKRQMTSLQNTLNTVNDQ